MSFPRKMIGRLEPKNHSIEKLKSSSKPAFGEHEVGSAAVQADLKHLRQLKGASLQTDCSVVHRVVE